MAVMEHLSLIDKTFIFGLCIIRILMFQIPTYMYFTVGTATRGSNSSGEASARLAS